MRDWCTSRHSSPVKALTSDTEWQHIILRNERRHGLQAPQIAYTPVDADDARPTCGVAGRRKALQCAWIRPSPQHAHERALA